MHYTITKVIDAAKRQTEFPQEFTVMLAGMAVFYDRHVPNLEMDEDGAAARLVGDCPLCQKARGFSADILNGNWHCKGCAETGMLDDFIRLKGNLSHEEARAIADQVANDIMRIADS